MNNNEENKVVYLRIDDIIPNRFQPREVFDETGLEELADSIKEHGVIQPIIVRQMGNKYELIAGERRTKASSLAGLTTIPAIIKNMDDKESAKVSLLENLQRKNLSAIEEARTYKRILELDNMTQEDLARTMGKSQPLIANKLRLLALPEEVQDALIKNQISERHARSLLNIKEKQQQLMLLERIKNERLTVRDLDNEIKKIRDMNNSYLEETTMSDSIPNVGFDYNNFNQSSKEIPQDNYASSYGNMGLDDYKSQVNSNMFNNIPSNYQSLGASDNQFNNMYTNNNVNNNELGLSMSDIGQAENNTMLNQGNNFENNYNEDRSNTNYSSLGSMFDNNPMSNNQFIPSEQESTENSNIFISNIHEEKSMNNTNQFIPNFEENNQSRIGSFDNNFDSSLNHDFNNNFSYGEVDSSTNFENPEFNSIVSPIESNFDQNNNFGFESNMYEQNQGNLFNQPLDITDVSSENSYNVEPEYPKEETEYSDLYENILNANPVPVQTDTNLESNEYNMELKLNDNYKENTKEEEKNQYISLDPVRTIFDTRGAVLELKKTTDRIKQNNINMESEEIDFDDYYQIIIKIKKDQI